MAAELCSDLWRHFRCTISPELRRRVENLFKVPHLRRLIVFEHGMSPDHGKSQNLTQTPRRHSARTSSLNERQ